MLTLACGGPAPVDRAREVPSSSIVPAADVGATCLDVADQRVCWSDSGAATVVPRTLPSTRAASALGFRCTGGGSERTCRDRALDASLFECAGGLCVQHHVRLPDDGQWECDESAGALVCRGGGPAAGVPPGPADDGFVCGTRSGTDERLCVDFAPDRPPFANSVCTVDHEGGTETRFCVPREPAVASCPTHGPCDRGFVCASATCVPARPSPGCWLDSDCDADGVCVQGTCR